MFVLYQSDFSFPELLAFCCTQVGRDPRPVMRQVYEMFKDGGDPRKVLNTTHILVE